MRQSMIRAAVIGCVVIGGISLAAQEGLISSETFMVQWGFPTDIPMAGDFDGDCVQDIVVYRPRSGEWFVLLSSKEFDRAEGHRVQWGLRGDTPMTGDYNGDQITDFAVYRPATGTWFIKFSQDAPVVPPTTSRCPHTALTLRIEQLEERIKQLDD